MFSSSVAGAGSICLGCQLRAVTRRAAPVLAARAVAQTPTSIRKRRYASDSSEPASSNDDFLESILSEQRHDDVYDPVAPKKKKGLSYKVKSKKQRDAFADTFKDQTSPFYSQHEVGFEDVWDQDPELENPLGKEKQELDSATGCVPGRSDPAPVEHESDEIDYGSGAAEEAPHLYLENYSWNAQSAAELRQQYADRKYRPPKKVKSQPEAQPAVDTVKASSNILPKLQKKLSEKKQREAQEQRLGKDSDWDITIPRKPRVKNTDNLYDWRAGNSASSQEQHGDNGLEWGEVTATEPPEPRAEELMEPQIDEVGEPEVEEAKLPTIKHYRKGAVRLVEDLSQLSVETLGQDAPVIVLREQGPWRNRPMKEDTETADGGLRIQDHADQEEGLSLDLILENIDGLRPDHRILPARDFKDVFDILMKGFTAMHLETYIERNRQRLAQGDETPFLGVIPDELMSKPWILSQSRWVPEVKGAVADVAHPLKGYILKTMPPKQRLAMQLMRECWGMSVQELLHGQGVLDLEVRDMEFRLLTLGNQRFLQQISRVHLSQGGGKSIQVVKSRKALQIIAPKAVAESCLKAIDETLQKIRTKSVTIDRLPVKNLNDDMLEELGRITNSLVEMNETQQEINVTWIDSVDRYNSKLEDISDVVLRLILAAYPPVRTSKALTVYPDPAEKGRLIEDIGHKDKLPWNDRRLKWARLCLPVATKLKNPQLARHWPLGESMLKYKIEPVADDLIDRTSTIDPKKRAFYESLAGVPLRFPRPPRESEETQLSQVIQPTTPTLSGWLPFRVRTTAVFGHVLHLNNKYFSASIKQGADAAAASRRTVSPLIPPVTGMHLPAWVPYKQPKYMTSLITMHFTPTSSTPSSTPAAPDRPPPAPALELRIKATDDEIIEIDSLRATAHTHVSDICLPGEHVDVRATQRLVAELPGTSLDTTDGMQPLIQFLADASLDVAQGRLVTPPVLDGLGLPSWLFYTPETDTQSPFLRSRVLAELYDATKAAAAASAPMDGAEPTTTTKKKKKASKKAKKPTATATATAPAAQHDPYHPLANTTLTPTSYIFSGLEVHRPVETSYDGWKLTYTSIEAGAGGGRRAELALEAVPSGDKDVRRQGSRIDAGAWLRSVYKLATGQTAKGGKKGEEGTKEEVEEDEEESERATSLVQWVGEKM